MSSTSVSADDPVTMIRNATTDRFTDLVEISELDPARDFRFADLSYCDFEGCDLAGFDFTGARLHGCNFKGAKIAGARFDQAEFGRVVVQPKSSEDLSLGQYDYADISESVDWPQYQNSWNPHPKPAQDLHLTSGAVFHDAPFAPRMVVVASGTFRSDVGQLANMRKIDIGYRFAVGIIPVTLGQMMASYGSWKATQTGRDIVTKIPIAKYKVKSTGASFGAKVTWKDSSDYATRLARATGKSYRLLSEAEWVFYPGALQTAPEIDDHWLETTEWCQDTWHHIETDTLNDGSAFVGPGQSRVQLRRTKTGTVVRVRGDSKDGVKKAGFRVARTLDE